MIHLDVRAGRSRGVWRAKPYEAYGLRGSRPLGAVPLVVTIASAIVLSVFLPCSSADAALPHGGFGPTTQVCASCHVPHQAASSSHLFSIPASASISGEISVCYSCHDGSGASTNVKTGSSNSFSLTSGHRVENTTESAGFSVDLTNRCSDCHAPHATYASSRRLPKASIVTSSGTFAVTGANNTWCLACHNDAQDWYKSTTSTAYPAASAPTVDASGYPVTGTFPGKTVYNNTTKNRHAAISAGIITDPMVPSQTATRVAGDCLWCHAAHRGKSRYDSLTTTFGAPATSTVTFDRTRGDYAAACFTCHGGGSWETSGAVNIKRYAVKTPDDASATSGHRIKTTGAALPLNSPLPCYDCHNPHGSTRNNQMMLADTLGQSLEATVSGGIVTTNAIRVREFCFTCHSTSDSYVWASASATYTVTTTAMRFQGLRRDGTLLAGQTRPSGYSLNQNYLRVKALGGSDHHAKASTKNCYDCHGKTYSGAGSPNVHAPTMGVSGGGTKCLDCHSGYAGMVSDTTSYHHVLDAPVADTAPASGAYPTSTSSLACVSCHVDHNYFNNNQGSNLRQRITDPNGANNAATDYIAVGQPGAPGICLSCHQNELPRNQTGQKVPVRPATTVWPIDVADYDASPHSYGVQSTYGQGASQTTFTADCAKCHNDTLPKAMQTSANQFGMHQSCDRRILAALGVPAANYCTDVAAIGSQLCYFCHSYASDDIDGRSAFTYNRGAKTVGHDTYDYYGVVTNMSTGNIEVWRQIFSRGYSHREQDYAGVHMVSPDDENQAYISANKHVECADCHNHHIVGDVRHDFGSTNLVSESIRGVTGSWATTTSANWSTAGVTLTWTESATREYEICFKCHSRANTGMYTSWNELNWTDVAKELNPGNQSYHPVMQALPAADPSAAWGSSRVGAGQVSDGWQPGDTMYCSDCHGDSTVGTAAGPHGSTAPYILKAHTPTAGGLGPRVYWPRRPDGSAYTINNVTSDYGTYGDTQLYCANCHEKIKENIVHLKNYGSHGSAACTACHILVPHGGKVSRLIATYNPGDLTSTDLPARYVPGGNPSAVVKIEGFRKQPNPGDYKKTDCNINCGTMHATSNTGLETW